MRCFVFKKVWMIYNLGRRVLVLYSSSFDLFEWATLWEIRWEFKIYPSESYTFPISHQSRHWWLIDTPHKSWAYLFYFRKQVHLAALILGDGHLKVTVSVNQLFSEVDFSLPVELHQHWFHITSRFLTSFSRKVKITSNYHRLPPTIIGLSRFRIKSISSKKNTCLRSSWTGHTHLSISTQQKSDSYFWECLLARNVLISIASPPQPHSLFQHRGTVSYI